jgi:hypothetical protein
MSLDSRKKLFNKFSSQLHLLKDMGLIDIELKYDKTYICPICLDQFCEEDLENKGDGNYLTEEDAPPAALSGKRIALTCHKCNSKAGHQIDNHLVNNIIQIDDSHFRVGATVEGSFIFEGKKIAAEIISKGDGILEVHHKIKNNNPTLLEKFAYGIKNKTIGPILDLKFKMLKVDSQKVNRSLLKTSYIITFSKFGYIFLLDNFYDHIRSEIDNLDYDYTGQIFVPNQLSEEQVGTFYINNPGAESILNVFALKTKYSDTIIGSIFPYPGSTPERIQYSLTGNGEHVRDGILVQIDTNNYDNTVDLFSDSEEIIKIHSWVYQ